MAEICRMFKMAKSIILIWQLKFSFEVSFMSNRSTIWPVCTVYHLFSILGMVWNDIPGKLWIYWSNTLSCITNNRLLDSKSFIYMYNWLKTYTWINLENVGAYINRVNLKNPLSSQKCPPLPICQYSDL